MYRDELQAVGETAVKKYSLLSHHPAGYFLASILAGMFIGFGVTVIGTIAGLLNGQPYVKIVMGFAFGSALSLVVIAGAELFTGNNFVMAAGALLGKVTWKETVRLWIVCYAGNWIGSLLIAVLFAAGGFASGATAEAMAAAAVIKMTVPPLALFVRGVLCNILVCLAVWCSFRCRSDSGKLMMVFWCLFVFNICGFEHSVANMTYLTIAMINPAGQAVTVLGYFYNIFIVSAGNIVGAVLFVALPYYLIAEK